MREIELTQGKVAIVDDGDYAYLSQFKWYAHKPKAGGRDGNIWYATRHIRLPSGRVSSLAMHRAIMEASNGVLVDHVDGDGLNNQRVNLRLCTYRQNRLNSPSRRIATSKYKGVSWNSRAKKWQAQIGVDGKNIYLGCFLDELEAASVYDHAAQGLHGEFARTNFTDREQA